MRKRGSNNDGEEESFAFTSRTDPSGAQPMALHATHSGIVEKSSNSWLVWLFPCIWDKWQPRFLVLIGSFLYRYIDESSCMPKGAPIPLDTATVSIRKGQGQFCFILSNFQKTYEFRAKSPAEARQWVAAIQQRAADAVRERMGHAETSTEKRRANRIGTLLYDKAVSKKVAKQREELSQSASLLGDFSPLNSSSSS